MNTPTSSYTTPHDLTARRGRCAGGAGGALEPAVSQPPTASVGAVKADEPVRPTQPLQVVETVGVGPKPRLELAQ